MDRNLEDTLKRDPIREAEELIKHCDKHGVTLTQRDRDMTILGHGIAVNKLKREALQQRDDSDYGCKLDRYKRIITEIGFQEVLRLPIEGRETDKKNNAFYVYFREKGGLVLVFDTYWGEESVNGGNFYYNWKPTNPDYSKYDITSSGSWNFNCPPELDVSYEERYKDGIRQETPAIKEKDQKRKELFFKEAVWIGSHDCREAIRHNIQKLEEFGQFVSPWVEQPFLWLLHYMDTKDAKGNPTDKFDYKKINSERIAMLPEKVRKVMGGQ